MPLSTPLERGKKYKYFSSTYTLNFVMFLLYLFIYYYCCLLLLPSVTIAYCISCLHVTSYFFPRIYLYLYIWIHTYVYIQSWPLHHHSLTASFLSCVLPLWPWGISFSFHSSCTFSVSCRLTSFCLTFKC